MKEEKSKLSPYKVPLSAYSATFYYEWRINQNRSDYNLVVVQAFEGFLCEKKLNHAVKRLVSDYIILNSHIDEENDKLYWVKNEEVYGLDTEIIFSNKDLAEYILKPFDLNKGPLYRFALTKDGFNKYKIIIILHHILIDGSSTDYFLDEISHYYNDEVYKCELDLSEQLRRMNSVSVQLTEYLKKIRKKSLLYWKDFLSLLDPIELSFLKAYTKQQKQLNLSKPLVVQDYSEISEIRFGFDEEIGKKIRLFCKKYKITNYLYGKIIFAILLHKYTGIKKFSISYPVAIREGADLIYGAHVNTVLSSFDFSKNINLNSLINDLRASIKSLKKDDIKNHYLPIAEIISSRDKNLINLSFAQTNIKEHKLDFKGAKTSIVYGTNVDLFVDLSWEQDVSNNLMSYCVKFKKRNIDNEFIVIFIDCYKKIFIDVLDKCLNNHSNSDLTINEISLLNNDAIKKIIYEWNETDREYPRDKTIQRLFEEQVERTPDNVAVVYEETKLTYRELNNRANQLAHHIRQNQEITPDTLIALCLDRSEHMLIGILGTLKAGGAYVPMDPSYPDERIQYILEDTNTKLILTNEVHKERLQGIVNDKNSRLIDVSVKEDKKARSKSKDATKVLAIDNLTTQKHLSKQSRTNPLTETVTPT